MGIQGLTKLLSDECPECIREIDLEALTGRKVAIDASMAMYQFLIAVRSAGDRGGASQQLTNEAGDITSHIQGMFNRTIRMLTKGVKPVYVFDGKPPTMKGGELAKRSAKRAKAEEDLKSAEEAGDAEDVDKFQKRLVKVSKKHNEDCKKLLGLMGVPVVDALSEAEAQCAVLANAGMVYGTGTEDMDALTFKTPKLLRKMTFAANAKQPVLEVDYTKVLSGLDMTHEQFVDLCILCGCDYTDSIKGIGPKKALNLIRQHKSIEEILKHLDRSKYSIPSTWLVDEATKADKPDENGDEEKSEEVASGKDDEKETSSPAESGDVQETGDGKVADANMPDEALPMYKEARRIFMDPEAYPADSFDLKWKDPDEEGLKAFLVEEMQFSGERVDAGIAKLKAARKLTSQRRMDSFFKVLPSSGSSSKGIKRKADEKKGAAKAGAKKGKTKSGKPRR